MLGRNGGSKTKTNVADTLGSAKKSVLRAADAAGGYVDPLAKDEKLRERLAAAMLAGLAARQRLRERTGPTTFVRRAAADPVLRAELIELGTQLRAAQKRAQKVAATGCGTRSSS